MQSRTRETSTFLVKFNASDRLVKVTIAFDGVPRIPFAEGNYRPRLEDWLLPDYGQRRWGSVTRHSCSYFTRDSDLWATLRFMAESDRRLNISRDREVILKYRCVASDSSDRSNKPLKRRVRIRCTRFSIRRFYGWKMLIRRPAIVKRVSISAFHFRRQMLGPP